MVEVAHRLGTRVEARGALALELHSARERDRELLADAARLETVLRREKVAMPYEQLKELTRGRTVTMADFKTFIEALEVTPSVKKELLMFTPENYIGLAAKLAGL